MKIYDTLDLTQPGVELGNHGVWLPEMGVKVPFQWGGQITKRTRYQALGSRETIVDEVAILRALASEQLAPPVGEIVFFKEVISDYPGAWHCDPCGAYGFELADARKLPHGKFTLPSGFVRMRQMPIVGSEGAWNDVLKPGNIVNGYLVDCRRSLQDLLTWQGVREPLPEVPYDPVALAERVHRECQFPPGERAQAYQDFWMGQCRGHIISMEAGQRRVKERAELMGLDQSLARDANVLDIGTQSGGFLQYAWAETRGTGRYAGVDINPSYIACAKDLARSCNQNICFRQLDVTREHLALLNWVRAYFPQGVDHLLLLSMEKHLGHAFMFELVDAIAAKHTYIETNAVAKDDGTGPEPAGEMKLWAEVQARGGVHAGNSRDRNLRRLYRIDRGGQS